jgi:uncharacterized protein (TIGR03382 family)
MARSLQALLVAASGVLLLAATTVASLIALNAECNGADCPRSDAYRNTVLAIPITAALLLMGGAVWSVRRRRLWPLVLAQAAVLAVAALTDAVLNEADVSTVVWLVVAVVAGRAALRRRKRGCFT